MGPRLWEKIPESVEVAGARKRDSSGFGEVLSGPAHGPSEGHQQSHSVFTAEVDSAPSPRPIGSLDTRRRRHFIEESHVSTDSTRMPDDRIDVGGACSTQGERMILTAVPETPPG